MAKGKHAAQSAIRRAEAAHEHIDRLTDQLVDAKTRARKYEAAALRVPAMEGELLRLRTHLENMTSDQLEREREAHAQEITQFRERIAMVAMMVGGMLEEADSQGANLRMSGGAWEMFSAALGPDGVNEFLMMRSMTREQSRGFASGARRNGKGAGALMRDHIRQADDGED